MITLLQSLCRPSFCSLDAASGNQKMRLFSFVTTRLMLAWPFCSNVQCPAFSSSPPGSTEGSSCLCNSGYYGSYTAGCVKCPAGSYCSGGTVDQAVVIASCPANSNSPEGSEKLSDCTCDVGYMGSPSPSTGCSRCPAGSYCPGDGVVTACAPNSNSPAGSQSGIDCQCDAAYYEPVTALAVYEESTNFARACGANKDGPCPTFQSSTTHGGDAARADNSAGLSGQWNSGSCTHTATENNPWWRVDMEQQVEVTSLTIVGRSDCCSERTQGFAVC